MWTTLEHLYLYAKIISAACAISGFGYGVFKYLTTAYKQRLYLSETVHLLATNHLPHIQMSLDAHGESLKSLTSDVRDVGTKVDGMEQRLDDTKLGVHVLGESFLRHLENVTIQETSKKRKRKS